MRSNGLLIVGFACFALACEGNKKSEKTKFNAEAAQIDSIGEAGIDYPKLFCSNGPKIKLRANITEELSLLCNGNSPTPEFLRLRAKALTQVPGQIDVSYTRQISTEADDRSDFLLTWVFHVPVRPFIVKGRPLYDYIAKGHSDQKVKFDVTRARLPDAQLDPGGLHLWSVDMGYSLAVQALPTLTLSNTRKTQYNLYQVLSGNEEIGMAVEHLVESPGDIYKFSNLTSVSFNDGEGFNDGKGGTVVINFLKFDFNNQGFPETAVTTMLEVAKALANHMYEGLKQ